MPASKNRHDALARIEALRLQDAASIARKLKLSGIPKSWPRLPDNRGIDHEGFKKLLEIELSRPDHPLNWHKQALAKANKHPRVKQIYYKIRKNLWHFPEFLTLTEKAKTILEIIVELARDEAFPWLVNVQAREVMRLARLNHVSMTLRLKELECFAITRPARRISLYTIEQTKDPLIAARQMPSWPSPANNFNVNLDDPLTPIPQWVIRYRRGIPFNANRAAWWINYDLLCNTQRVLPCFEVCLDTLAKPYESRNRRLGTRPGITNEDAFKALQRTMAKRGPLPKPGLRAVLWEGMEAEPNDTTM
ncbi:MAG: hypothetical protein IH984_00635 [Planctomycetes bacterium]|nr:hypothetical protein [Planctomycetota bacterium]